jgi:hypothetical protein
VSVVGDVSVVVGADVVVEGAEVVVEGAADVVVGAELVVGVVVLLDTTGGVVDVAAGAVVPGAGAVEPMTGPWLRPAEAGAGKFTRAAPVDGPAVATAAPLISGGFTSSSAGDPSRVPRPEPSPGWAPPDPIAGRPAPGVPAQPRQGARPLRGS